MSKRLCPPKEYKACGNWRMRLILMIFLTGASTPTLLAVHHQDSYIRGASARFPMRYSGHGPTPASRVALHAIAGRLGFSRSPRKTGSSLLSVEAGEQSACLFQADVRRIVLQGDTRDAVSRGIHSVVDVGGRKGAAAQNAGASGRNKKTR